MQRELDYLRQQLSQGGSVASPVHEEVRTAPGGPWHDADNSLVPAPTTAISQSHSYSTFSETNSSADDTRFTATGLLLEDPVSPRHSSTVSRLLDGREYDAQRIDDCFDL